MNVTTENIEHSRLGGKIIDTAPTAKAALLLLGGSKNAPGV